MKVAIVSDVHGNLTALEAVIADLERVRPDLVVHGGDLVLMGARPAEVLDRIRELGWPGVMGNTDEDLWTLDSIPAALAHRRPEFEHLATWARERLSDERVAWLQALPLEWKGEDIGLVHAVPGDLWRVIPPDANDATLTATYGPLGTRIAVYCHIHWPYIRRLPGLIVANSGSVGLPFDGDNRSAYLLIEDGEPQIRRVAYDVEREVALLEASGDRLLQRNIEVLRRGAPSPPAA